MQRHSMLMGKELTLLKCPYTQSHIQIQCKLYKNSNDDFHRNRKRILKSVWNHKKIGTKQSCERRTKVKSHTGISAILQSYSNQKAVSLHKIDTKINETEHINKPTYIV